MPYKKINQSSINVNSRLIPVSTLNNNVLFSKITENYRIYSLDNDFNFYDLGINGLISGISDDNSSIIFTEYKSVHSDIGECKLFHIRENTIISINMGYKYFNKNFLITYNGVLNESKTLLIKTYTFYDWNYNELKKFISTEEMYFYDSFKIKISDEIIVYREGRMLPYGNKIVFLRASDFREIFSFDINILKEYVPLWQEEPSVPYCHGESFGDIAISYGTILIFGDTTVFTVGSRKFAEEHHRIIGIDIRDGSLKYVSDLVNPNQIYEYENKLYCKNGRILYQIDPDTGIVIKSYDFNEVCIKHSVEDHPYYKFYDHDFFIGDGVLILGEYRKYNFMVLELETGKVLLHYKFKMGVEVPKDVHRMSLPIYHNGKVYVNSGNFDLFIFDLKRD